MTMATMVMIATSSKAHRTMKAPCSSPGRAVAGAFSRRVGQVELLVVGHRTAEGAEHQHHEQRQDEGELDERSASLSPAAAIDVSLGAHLHPCFHSIKPSTPPSPRPRRCG